jgi:hypothetical protein
VKLTTSSSAEIRNMLSCTSTDPYVFIALVLKLSSEAFYVFRRELVPFLTSFILRNYSF